MACEGNYFSRPVSLVFVFAHLNILLVLDKKSEATIFVHFQPELFKQTNGTFRWSDVKEFLQL
jgi:hypothetical protein